VSRHPQAGWRNTVRDCRELASTSKLVALVLSTYMNGDGRAYPSKTTLAAGTSLSLRAIDKSAGDEALAARSSRLFFGSPAALEASCSVRAPYAHDRKSPIPNVFIWCQGILSPLSGRLGDMSEAVVNQAAKRPQAARGPRFGAGIDPREAGRRGGVASGISRRQRPIRELESKVLESRNGAAAVKLLEIRMRRDRALEAAQINADRTVMWLVEEADAERATLDRLRADVADTVAEYNALLGERDKLRRDVTELRAQLTSDAGLVEWLRTPGEERVTAAADMLGWIADGDVAP